MASSFLAIVGQEELLGFIEAYVGPRQPRAGYREAPYSSLGLERLSWRAACTVLEALKPRDDRRRTAHWEQACYLRISIRRNCDDGIWRGRIGNKDVVSG